MNFYLAGEEGKLGAWSVFKCLMLIVTDVAQLICLLYLLYMLLKPFHNVLLI